MANNTSRLFVFSDRELAFLQKISRADYQFITDEEQSARQSLRDKLNEVVLIPRENRIQANLTTEELAFLAVIVGANLSFVTETEREARKALRERLETAARA